MNLLEHTKTQIRRSPYQAIAAILMTFLTLLLGGFVGLFGISSSIVLKHFEGKPQITVFFSDAATVDTIQKISKTLESTGKTKSITYISKDDALLIYKEQNKNDPLLLEMVTADILPASLEISANDPEYLKDIEALVRQEQMVEEVVYQKDVVDQLVVWTNAIRIAGGLLTLLLVFVSISTLMTMISLKIALKKDEIEILNLVGASPSYIRGPFLMEGSFYGISGAFFAWLFITIPIIILRPNLMEFLGTIPEIGNILKSPTSFLFISLSISFLLTLIVFGVILGLIGSMFALRRFLKLTS